MMVILGDSIAYGLDDPRGGWVTHWLENRAESLSQGAIVNLSRPGATSKQCLTKMRTFIRKNTPLPTAIWLILACGINDSAVLLKNGQENVSIAAYQTNIRTIFTKARSHRFSLGVVGLTAVDETKTLNYCDAYRYTNRRIEQYHAALQDICTEFRIPFVDLYSMCRTDFAWVTEKLSDGLHPNASGHQWIAERIHEALGPTID